VRADLAARNRCRAVRARVRELLLLARYAPSVTAARALLAEAKALRRAAHESLRRA
jgi:hypothetical protein